MKLYELTNELLVLQSQLEDGELDQSAEEYLDSLTLAVSTKVEGICQFLKNLGADVDAFEAEIRRLSGRKNVKLNAIKRLKRYMLGQLQLQGIGRLKAGLFDVSVRKNPVSYGYEGDAKDLPEQFRIDSTISRVNLDAVKEAYAAGSLPDGFSVNQDSHLRIS